MSKALRAELEALQAVSKDGMLHAEQVLTWAKRNKKSALHKRFEWNNGKAAHEFRLIQARHLIQLNITTEDGTPKLVSLSYDRARGGGYRDIEDVRSDKKLSDVLLHDALVELQRVQAKYQRVQQLTKVWNEVERVRARQEKKAALAKDMKRAA